MERKPIKRVSADPRPHPHDHSLLQIVIRLSVRPPTEWEWAFLHAPGRVLPMDDGLSGLSGDVVVVSCEDSQVKEVVALVDERIDLANRVLERNTRPDEETRRKEQATADRLAAARAKLNDR